MFFKVFNEHWENEGLSFGLDQTTFFSKDGKPQHEAGINFYMSAKDTLANEYSPERKIALVIPEPEGAIIWDDKISKCEALRVIQELKWGELFAILQIEELYPQLTNAFSLAIRNIPDKYETEMVSYFYGWNKSIPAVQSGLVKRDANGQEQRLPLDAYSYSTKYHNKENVTVCN